MESLNIYEVLAHLKSENKPSYLITVIKTKGTTSCRVGAKMIVVSDSEFYGTIGGGEVEFEVRKILSKGEIGKPKIIGFNLTGKDLNGKFDGEVVDLDSICSGYVEVFIEPINSDDYFYIVGGGHCGVELSPLAKRCGFFVTVIDHREEWASKEKHPFADKLIVCDYDEVEKYIKFSDKTYVVVMTPKHQYDELVVSKLVGKKLKYLGFMGSEFKVKNTFKNFIGKGFNVEDLKKIFAPIGFPIKSNTPIEIAISIMAQVIAVKNNLSEINFSSNPLLKK